MDFRDTCHITKSSRGKKAVKKKKWAVTIEMQLKVASETCFCKNPSLTF